MAAEILINVRPNTTRVAYVEDGVLSDLKIERRGSPTLVGSIYKGRVVRVLPGMQAAFVDVGLDRAAFLYVADVRTDLDAEPRLYIDQEDADPELPEKEEVARAPIQDLLHEGQIIMVQVAKDPLGTKGARITTHISLAGRHVVFMPTLKHLGISRRIEDESERERLKKIVEGINPKGGVIIRTACEGASAEALGADLDYLGRMWSEVEKAYDKRKTPGLINPEIDVELRALRDLLNERVQRVIVDDKNVHKKVLTFINQFMPKHGKSVTLHSGPQPLFDIYDLDLEISRSLDRKIWLKSGGYIVVDEAEALVVIDVNTGRYVGKKDLEDTILKTNLEAVKEIAHQLRIRNCGGIIIIDLIDMEKPQHREKVLNQLRSELANDLAKTTVVSMSELGLVEMTRKRTSPSLVSSLCEPCTYCEGNGYIKRKSTVAQEIFLALEREVLRSKEASNAVVHCHSSVADWIYEEEQEALEAIEAKIQRPVVFKVEPHYHIEQFEIYSLFGNPTEPTNGAKS
ncbi:MAG: Rne/Rng family ribonuclease [Bdellovibrionales bacterium]|nr:Rne/Rng family ribonuclease [Bdellovibrionales bacterium]